jgi:hypothetical protein
LILRCKLCGESFAATRKSRGRHLGFCQPACRDLAAKARAERYRGERRYERHMQCPVCQQPFSTFDRAVQTCGVACGIELKSRRAAARRRESLASGDLFSWCAAHAIADCEC